MNNKLNTKLPQTWKKHRLKKLSNNLKVLNNVPDAFLADLLNSMEISCAEFTDAYKNWPEMFEEEAE